MLESPEVFADEVSAPLPGHGSATEPYSLLRLVMTIIGVLLGFTFFILSFIMSPLFVIILFYVVYSYIDKSRNG